MPFGFRQRRKSSAVNVIEDVSPPPAHQHTTSGSSFRVIPRNEVQETARLSVHRTSTAPVLPSRNSSYDHEAAANSNRTSEASTGRRSYFASKIFDTSSSQRYSSTSTLPSSADEDHNSRKSHNTSESSAFSIKHAAARTFSLGVRNPKAFKSTPALNQLDPGPALPPPPPPPRHMYTPNSQASHPPLPPLPPQHTVRDRSQTLTAPVAPKIEDSLAFDDSDDFGNMFAGLEDKRKSTAIGARGLMGQSTSPSNMPRKPAASKPNPSTPAPLALEFGQDVEASPYSWDSQRSHDGLIAKPSPAGFGAAVPSPRSPGFRDTAMANAAAETPDRRSISFTGARKNAKGQYEDSDALIVKQSARASRAEFGPANTKAGGYTELKKKESEEDNMFASPMDTPRSDASSNDADLTFTSQSGLLNGSQNSRATPSRAMPSASEEPYLDVAQFGHLALGDSTAPAPKARGPSLAPPTSMANKRLTTAQFEQLSRQQQQQPDDDSDDDLYEDEDEIEERQRLESEKKRAEQMQKLAVHRKIMSKTSGGNVDVDDSKSRVSAFYNVNSPPALSLPNLATVEDDSDDDTPLGILAEHGFPSKTRPPNHQFSSTPSIIGASGMVSHPPVRPSSASGSVGSGQARLRASQPAFARRLPFDPLQSNTLMNQASREQMGYGRSDAQSMYGGSQMGGHMSMGPMGPMGQMGMNQAPPQNSSQPTLVGIIQQEEKSKAKRRGSPNTGAGNVGAGSFSANGFQPQTENFPMQRQSFMPQQGFQQQQFAQQQMFNPHASMMMMPGQPMMPGQMTPGGMGRGYMDPNYGYMTPQMQAIIEQQVQQQVAMQTFRMGLEIGAGGSSAQSNSPRAGTPGSQMPGAMRTASGNMPPRASSTMSFHGGAPGNGFLDPNANPNRNTTHSMPLMSRMSMMSGNNDARSVHGQNQGYAASLAPSERSNIGQASRYRPVTNQMGDVGSTGASSVTISGAQEPGNRASTIRILDQPKPAQNGADDDEDEGWGILKSRKKGKKKSKVSSSFLFAGT